MKALDRKVWLPSGGSLVIDRTEAMTVIDVNTGKFVGSGGNLEQTVTRNNLEAAEEIVRQLRLRDVGGIVVIDFIDMVLESNRDLVLRRLTECLGRDRTKHQVAEVTSLGLVQMTRKRVGEGLLEAFSEPCRCATAAASSCTPSRSTNPATAPTTTIGPAASRASAAGAPGPATPTTLRSRPRRQRQAASAAMAAIHRATHASEADADEPDVAPDSEIVEVTLAEDAPEFTPDLPTATGGRRPTVDVPTATGAPTRRRPTRRLRPGRPSSCGAGRGHRLGRRHRGTGSAGARGHPRARHRPGGRRRDPTGAEAPAPGRQPPGRTARSELSGNSSSEAGGGRGRLLPVPGPVTYPGRRPIARWVFL